MTKDGGREGGGKTGKRQRGKTVGIDKGGEMKGKRLTGNTVDQ
jgi:hypothetical protein